MVLLVIFFTWKSVRCNKDPGMVAPFVCTALWDKILTCDNLMKKGITLVDWCCMHRCNGKNEDHFIVHCDVAQKLWSLLSSMFGDAYDHCGALLWLEELDWKTWQLFGMEYGPLMSNMDTLEGEEWLFLMGWKFQWSVIKLKYSFVISLFEWSQCMEGNDRHSLVDFIDPLSFFFPFSFLFFW